MSFLVAGAIAAVGSVVVDSKSVLESAEGAGEEISHPCHLQSSSCNVPCCTRHWNSPRLWR